MPRPKGQTAAGAATRARLFEIATRLFAERGYAGTTLRGIAAEAGVSPGLLYKHFPSKAAVVLELYERLSAELAARPLPDGPWRQRAVAALRESLAVLGPHREALRALIPVLVGAEGQGVLAEGTAQARARVEGCFVRAAVDARDAPGVAEPLGRVLYLAHLGVILAWLLDRSPQQRATAEGVALLERALGVASLGLRLPGAGGVVRRLDGIIQAAFFAEGVAEGAGGSQDEGAY